MEQELMNEKKIGATNISLLMLVYEYDLDKRRVDSLAKHMGWTVSDLHQNIERLREQDFYKRYYGMCSAFLDESRGIGRADLLDSIRTMPSTLSIQNAFRVLKDREVPMDAIAAKMASPAMKGTFAAAVSMLKDRDQVLPERKFMSEALLLTEERQTSEAVEKVNVEEVDAEPLRSLAEEVRTLTELQELIEKPEELLRPGVEAALTAIRGNDAVEESFEEIAGDDIAVGQLVRLITDTPSGWWVPSEKDGERIPELEALMPLLVETEWFKRYIGENMEHVDRSALLASQMAVAEAYVAYLSKEERLRPTLSARFEALQSERDLRSEWEMEAEYLLKHGGDTSKVINIESLRKAYGKDWSRAVGVMGRGDTLLFGTLLNRIENVLREDAAALREKPTLERLTAYERNLSEMALINRMISARPILEEVELRKLSGGTSTVKDHFVRLLFKESTGEIAIASRQPVQRGWRLLENAARESEAVRYAELLQEKLQAAPGIKPTAEMIREDWHQFLGQGVEEYKGMPLKAGEDKGLLSEAELARLRRIRFDHETAVNFDLANDGVADVVQTDENRNEYQQKVQRDGDNGQKKGFGR